MADVTFAGYPVVAGNLVLPLVGAGTAELYLADPDAAPAVGQSGELSVLGTARLVTVSAAGTEYGQVRLRAVSGRGRLDVSLEPSDYRGYSAGRIASDCLSEAGETAGAGWDSLSAYCAHWTRSQGPLRACLQRLLRLAPAGAHWRFAADGSAVYVVETWPDNASAVDRDRSAAPQERLVEVYPADGSLEPGQSVTCFEQARQAQRVEYRWGPQEIVCRAWY